MSGSISRSARIALRVCQVLVVAGLALYAAQAAVAICGAAATAFFETYVYTGLILAAAALCIARAAAFREERVAWLVIGSGLVAWSAGEIYYSVELADMLYPPLPSISDGLWLAFFPASYIGLVLIVRSRVREFPASVWLDGIVGALAVAAVGAALVAGPITSGADATVIAVDLSYLLGDLLLLGFVVGVFALSGWRPGGALTLLGVGLVTGAVVDGYFLHLLATGSQVDTTLVATLWPASALLVGFAAWARPSQASLSLEGVRMLVMPAVFAFTALGVLVVHVFDPLPSLALGLAVAALGTTIVRLTVTYRENQRLLERTRRDAHTDALTGLGNRRSLLEDLELAAARATDTSPRALIVFDLDGFKLYNDRFGHPVGDSLLSRLGRNLEATVGDRGGAYRLGGDEFCVVAAGSEDELVALADESREALSERGDGFEVGCSFGMILMPKEAADARKALNFADERLYAEKGTRRREQVSHETSNALAQALREVEPGLDQHLSEVGQLAQIVGDRLGMNEQELYDLTRAAELHDIGKIAIPDEVLRKAGPLDESEWNLVRQHTLVGDRILSAAPAMAGVAKLVRASAERYDGSGYPDKVAREEIPLGSRVVSVCDAYNAMTSDRPYRRALSHRDAILELKRCAGEHFDPEVVETFCEVLEAGAEQVDEPVMPRSRAALVPKPMASPAESPG